MLDYFEYIVVGSGPSGTMAAQTLVEAGKQVAMVDVGIVGKDYDADIPVNNFESIRRNDPGQYKYLLGEKLESVEWDGIKVGAQLTPPRKYIVSRVEELLPLISDTFSPMESMAYGGLGSGWGLGAYVYSDIELNMVGLNSDRMKAGYQKVADRIGISADEDDLSPYIKGHLRRLLPPLQMDNSTEKLYSAYQRKKSLLNRRGVYFGNPSMALLSVPFEDRQATAYQDVDFYTDRERAAYRPWITINALKDHPNFTYLGNLLVLRFLEDESFITIEAMDVRSKEKKSLKCRKMFLAAGVLGSARIVLRSFKNVLHRLPLLCNPYSYLPCIHARMLGIPLSEKKTSMAQAFMIYDEGNIGDNIVSAAIYTYRSLLLYKLIKEMPLNFADGLRIMNRIQSSLMIVGIHHPDAFSEQKFVNLINSEHSPTGDALFVHYKLSSKEMQKIANKERAIRRIFTKLGCYPLMNIRPKFGGSIHYAGTLPFNSSEMIGTTSSNGRLHGTRGVYVADGSGFNYLPAKGITLTLMANAHQTALAAIENL